MTKTQTLITLRRLAALERAVDNLEQITRTFVRTRALKDELYRPLIPKAVAFHEEGNSWLEVSLLMAKHYNLVRSAAFWTAKAKTL